MKLTEHALSAAPLLQAIAAGSDLSNAALAQATGRDARNMPRDLKRLVEAGWIARNDGQPPALTVDGQAIIDALARAENRALATDAAAVLIPLDQIDEDPELNPRESFDQAELDELTASVREHGVLQPIMVRPSPEPGRWRVVMGSRRRRAAIAAGLFNIAAVVRDLTDAEAFEVATIENVQRADMNPVEEARAFDRIIKTRQAEDPDLKLKDAKAIVADRVKKSTRFVELRLNLLSLPFAKQVEVANGALAPKEAVNWLRQNKPPEELRIAPKGLLMLAEIALYCDGAGDDGARVDGAVRDDERIAPLAKFELIARHDDWQTGEDFIRVTDAARVLLGERVEGWATDPLAAILKLRDTVLTKAEREAFYGEGGGGFVTPWLNQPFALHPSVVERKAREAADAEARAQREAQDAQARRDLGREGRAKLEAVRAFEAVAPALEPAAFAEQFEALLNAIGFTAPLTLRLEGEGRYADAVIRDAAGAGLQAAGAALEALRRLYAIAINRACGLEPVSGPDLATPWAAETSEDDDDDPDDGDDGEGGGELDAGDVTFADDPEDDGEVEIGDAEDDEAEQTPGFLRRLAGAGDSAEARS